MTPKRPGQSDLARRRGRSAGARAGDSRGPFDPLTREERSELMSRIRGRDTTPEILVRSALHRAGFRFRLYGRGLPGRPDIVLPKYGAVIFVHGCFWHRHGCRLATEPRTRRDFWQAKFAANVARDKRHARALRTLGWRVLTVWECALRTERTRERAIASLVRRLTAPR
jgi:DNA mismatch endonuclease (patch repair protein)